MAREANYTIVENTPGKPLVIRDVGDHSISLTITNDADNVVQRLHIAGHLPDNRRLLYWDTMGSLDELVHDNGRFKGFLPTIAGRGVNRQ
jgi:hypothetical protein